MVRTDCIAVLCFFCLFTIVPVQPDKDCTYPALNNFDIYKYLGVWYEIQFLLGDDDSDDEWTDLEIHVEEDSGIFYQDLRARDASDTCVYFKHEIQPNQNGWTKAVNDETFKWNVFNTDYTTYALLYGCLTNDQNKCNGSKIRILSRTKSLCQQILDQAQEMAETVCLGPLKNTQHVKSCPEEC